MIKVSSVYKALLVSSVLCCSSLTYAAVNVLTFNEFDHGEIVNDQYLSEYGVQITSENYNNPWNNPDYGDADPGNNVFDRQVAFDTTRSGTSDPDLEFFNSDNEYQDYDPLVLDMSGASTPGNILIMQENNTGCGDNTCNDPDDEGARSAGYFEFTFSDPVTILSLDLFDIEDQVDQPAIYFTIYFYDEFDSVVGSAELVTMNDGDWFRQTFNNIEGVLRMVVNMPGSGGLDNLAFKTTEVSAPHAAAVFLIGLAGIWLRSRRVS